MHIQLKCTKCIFIIYLMFLLHLRKKCIISFLSKETEIKYFAQYQWSKGSYLEKKILANKIENNMRNLWDQWTTGSHSRALKHLHICFIISNGQYLTYIIVQLTSVDFYHIVLFFFRAPKEKWHRATSLENDTRTGIRTAFCCQAALASTIYNITHRLV